MPTSYIRIHYASTPKLLWFEDWELFLAGRVLAK
jgi:hypothetical protein